PRRARARRDDRTASSAPWSRRAPAARRAARPRPPPACPTPRRSRPRARPRTSVHARLPIEERTSAKAQSDLKTCRSEREGGRISNRDPIPILSLGALVLVTSCRRAPEAPPAPPAPAVTSAAPQPAPPVAPARDKDHDVRPVYPLESGPPDPVAKRLCETLH